jgi:CrcB protein
MVFRRWGPPIPDGGGVCVVAEPMNSDVDLEMPAQRWQTRPSPWPVLAAISAGGVVGALSRYGIGSAWPHPAGGFPWATFVINVTGCLLIGVLMVLVTEVVTSRPLLRPFLGVGVLGGYTTFSTYIVDIQRAAGAGAALVALAYLGLTLIGALLAVWTGTTLTRAAVRGRRKAGARR